jgi:heme o synthase
MFVSRLTTLSFGDEHFDLESASDLVTGAILPLRQAQPELDLTMTTEPATDLKRVRNYCGVIKVARSGFLWEKTTRGEVASVYTNCETAVAAGVLPRSPAGLDVLAGYWALTKPDINLLIAITVFAGFCLARPTSSSSFPIGVLINSLLGTMLVAGGSGALNQYIERHFDAQMRRTARRPLAAGQVEPHHALCFGMVLSATGALYLAFGVNLLASLLAIATLICYLVLYTPLKRKTPLCTIVGALAGAAPPLIGWAAASGGLSAGAWMLYAMLFLWQFPHFMAIAWMYREDYDRAGYLVLPRGEGASRFMAWQSLLPFVVLIPLTLIPTLLGYAGLTYAVAALFLNASFLYWAVRLILEKSNFVARRLLTASIIYLPMVFLIMLLDKNG